MCACVFERWEICIVTEHYLYCHVYTTTLANHTGEIVTHLKAACQDNMSDSASGCHGNCYAGQKGTDLQTRVYCHKIILQGEAQEHRVVQIARWGRCSAFFSENRGKLIWVNQSIMSLGGLAVILFMSCQHDPMQHTHSRNTCWNKSATLEKTTQNWSKHHLLCNNVHRAY